ncbi:MULTISPECIES: phosphoenolpyruvate carboxylase [unclassified Flavobacterium]|uniref:phosphoenolpyruvate carboxylase n=1 Tax=unclassified Flavobacterium TaxID=196869 RepID=UPI001F138061|nr:MULTISPECIES: phosphoenolpyruvate carboxylase [unclassified Flavobacterium]UMY65352.1 phosphoenolpyruvate carboxylase [Flavobacterium sp. HJ-32-4]
MYTPTKLERFNQNVLSRYHIYNSVFITLPFDAIDNTGTLLPLFSDICEQGYQERLNPKEIFERFAAKYLEQPTEQEKIDLMFRFIQYVERQVVLFDAIEDAAFDSVNNLEGKGSLRDIKETAEATERLPELRAFLSEFNVRPVLTAHPTQFYPGSVLGIMTELTKAIRHDDLLSIKELLAQLGKTPFIKKEKPTPYDEAVSLTWYLENVFYPTAGDMIDYIHKNVFGNESVENPVIQLGFWPGGDRDGNPFVTTEITLKVADRLRTCILKAYYNEIRKLKRKLTFRHVSDLVAEIEEKLYRSVFYSKGELFITQSELTEKLEVIRDIVIREHQSLYLDDIHSVLNKIRLFGFHFATLDIRQNSKIHDAVFQALVNQYPDLLPEGYLDLPEADRIAALASLTKTLDWNDIMDETSRITLDSVQAMRRIQENNGEKGANRYIISNNEGALHVLETYAFFGLCGWNDPPVDIVPLFESVDDLARAPEVMERLYKTPHYRTHLSRRKNEQTVMLGFSDGTKDGGYLRANWSIYRAKEAITEVSRRYGIQVIFFDGRGGPPARGGGKTSKFYASLGPEIESREIQVTVQGQTISSNFGTVDSCRYNLENLLSAGVANHIFQKGDNALSERDKALLDDLAQLGYEKYIDFKNHPKFIPYLERMSTLRFYSRTNIGSRPSKRTASDQLKLSDLRAIPFVGSWSQLKHNVPGFFGVGTALKAYETSGRWQEVQDLYHSSLFFRTLLENSMMSLAKSFLPLTAYIADDPEFGDFWRIIEAEFNETKRVLLKIAGHSELMENYPDGKASIAVREKIVRPLLTIQQYALLRLKELNGDSDDDLVAVYEKLVTRSLFGNTNAARNSA